jgi:hypothetical protein
MVVTLKQTYFAVSQITDFKLSAADSKRKGTEKRDLFTSKVMESDQLAVTEREGGKTVGGDKRVSFLDPSPPSPALFSLSGF